MSDSQIDKKDTQTADLCVNSELGTNLDPPKKVRKKKINFANFGGIWIGKKIYAHFDFFFFQTREHDQKKKYKLASE